MMDTEENAQTNLRYRYPGKPSREDSSMQFDEDEHERKMNNRLQENDDDEYDVPDEESNVQSNVRSMEKSLERNAAVMS